MNLLDRFCETEFSSYEDFKENFKIKVPENFNFGFDIVDEYARLVPDKMALKWCDIHGNEAEFTFLEMSKLSNQAANMFKKHGIQKGDRVMLVLKRKYEFWICLVALHKIGASAIPATHMLCTKDLVYRNNAAGIKMIVATCDSDVAQYADEAQAESPTLETKIYVGAQRDGWISYEEEMKTASDVFPRPTGQEATQNKDLMLMYFTSGTTGFPKMVVHNNVYPLGHIVTAKFWQNVVDDGLHLSVADSGWAKCAWGKIYGQWIAGATIFVYDYDKFIPHEMLEVLEKYRITTFCAPPTIYRFFIKEDLTKYDLSSIQHCCNAGEPLSPEVFNQFLRMTGHKLHEGFGQSESAVMLANFKFFEPRIGSMGKPNPVYDIHLINNEGQECEVGEEGEIVVHTPLDNPALGLFCGFYQDRDKTLEVWENGTDYHTGDVAWRDEDGYYWFVGRTDDVIKSSGYRIGPFEVESALLEHPAVLEAAITAVPDPIRGQIVKATVVLAKGYSPSEELKKELQEHVKHATAPYKYPRIVDFVDELPKTFSGKNKRKEIRDNDSTSS